MHVNRKCCNRLCLSLSLFKFPRSLYARISRTMNIVCFSILIIIKIYAIKSSWCNFYFASQLQLSSIYYFLIVAEVLWRISRCYMGSWKYESRHACRQKKRDILTTERTFRFVIRTMKIQKFFEIFLRK